ncbi:O-antigen ligase family protein [Reinekea forsetii]|nr:O-antigen ligase family protein [Reinekea forsetii]
MPINLSLSFRELGLYLFIVTVYIFVRGLFGFNTSMALDAMLWVLLIIFGYLLVRSSNTLKTRWIILAITVPFTFYYFLVLIQYSFVLISPLDWNIQVLAVGFDNVRFLNQCQSFLFPLFICLMFYESRAIRVSSYFSAAFTIAFALYANGRGLILVLIFESLLMSIYIAYSQKNPIKNVLLLVKIWLVGLFFYTLLWKFIPSLIWTEVNGSSLLKGDGGRATIWKEALLIWREYPFFGIGGMAYSDPRFDFTYNLSHPHNSVLQVLLEYGLVGFVFSLFFFILFLIRAIKYFLIFDFQKHYPYIFLALLGGSALSLVSGVIVMPLSQFLWVLMICLVYVECSSNQESIISRPIFRLSVSFLRVMVIVLVLFLLILSYFTYQYIMGQNVLVMDAGPRYWLVGRFID